MTDQGNAELNRLFASPPDLQLPPDIAGELVSIMRLHSLAPKELFYKWESYSMKMGSEETKLDLPTARAFKNDVQEMLERESREKAHLRSANKRSSVGSTPRNVTNGGDVFGMLDGLVPTTPHPQSRGSTKGSLKRKAAHETPGSSRSEQMTFRSSPPEITHSRESGDGQANGVKRIAFSDRQNTGQAVEVLNDDLSKPEPPLAPGAEPRVKLKANTDLKKFSYRPMAMKLSEASEVLDDRIDEFAALIQTHHDLPPSAFGSAASQSTNEVVAVGRITSDALDAKLNEASLMLETSRRTGAGLRVPLRLESIHSYQFFPGQIVALKGVNASGDYFSVSEILDIPLLPPAASTIKTLDTQNELLCGDADAMEDEPRPLNILIGAGPYTPDDDLNFDALNALCNQAADAYADTLVLTGPFLDIEHPLVASGDFDLPAGLNIDPDTATLPSIFRGLIGAPLRRLAEAVPSVTIVVIPSVRDAVSKHVSWPQEQLARKELGLPKQVKILTNPCTLSLNEIVFGVSSSDVLAELRQEEVIGSKPKTPNMLARLSRHLIEQRHFFPLFPPASRERAPKPAAEVGLPTGAMLDTSYLKLGEWLNVRPDILILPSVLPPFAKILESVVVINPGTLSKRKAPGTYAQLTVHAARLTTEERAEGKMVGHKLFERGRVDIIRI
ncbi:MAG: hypothetical protein M1825_001981 [Sarcosagium campestre]|nr:MAG: hypothetical protein M1825_001981 [Sarcosagium campestre]